MAKYWAVEFPTRQYEEDVKAVASAAGLKVLDARYIMGVDSSLISTDTPTLTKKGEKKKRKQRKKKAVIDSDSE